MLLSSSGSYAGRMQPPGRPNMTSVPSISSDLIRAWAPVIFMGVLRCWLARTCPENCNGLPSGRPGTHAQMWTCV